MPTNDSFASVACRDLVSSTAWYTDLFDRAPDTAAMRDRVEWNGQGAARLRLERAPDRAGDGAVTLMLSAIGTQREQIAWLKPGAVEQGDHSYFVRLKDPDGNTVILTTT